MKRNQINAGIIISYLTLVINTIAQLVYTPIIIRLLGKTEYGLYTLVGSIANYLSLCGFGMTGSYLRFYSKYINDNRKERIASLNGTFIILNTIASCLAIIWGSVLISNIEYVLGSGLTLRELNRARLLMTILVLNVIFTFPNSVFESILVSQECFGFQRGIRLVAAFLNPVVGIPLLLAGYGSVALVCITTGLTVIILLINGFYCIKKIHASICFTHIEPMLMWRILKFSFFIFVNMIIDQVNWNVDKLLLGRYWGTAAVAVYGVAAQINSLYMQCSTTISSVFAPRINKYTAENTDESRQKINSLFISVGKVQFVILMLILSGILFFGRVFIELWVGKGYEEAYIIVLVLTIPVTIPLIQSLAIEIQRAKNKHYVRTIAYFFTMILNLIVSIFLSKQYGAIGAALGTAISLILGNGLFMNYYYGKHLQMDIKNFWHEISTLLPAMIPPFIFGGYIMYFQNVRSVVRLSASVVCYCTIYVISIWLFGIKRNEKVEIRNRIKNLIYEE